MYVYVWEWDGVCVWGGGGGVCPNAGLYHTLYSVPVR